MKKAIFFALLSFLITSCDVETFDSIVVLNPPLGLVAYMSNGTIALEFSAYNDEDYFSGFQIYGSQESAEESITNLFTNIYKSTGLASTNMYKMSQAARFTVMIASNYDNSAFQNGINYYFLVRSYTLTFNSNSLPSNIGEVIYEP